MKNAKLAVFECDDALQSLFRYVFRAAGHTIVAQACDVDEALEAVNGIEEKNEDCDAAVLDMSATKKGYTSDDVKKIVKHMHELDLFPKLIAYSYFSFKDAEIEFDYEVPDKDVYKVLDIVNSL